MFFHQRFIPGLAIASYLVGDEKAISPGKIGGALLVIGGVLCIKFL